MAIAFLTGSKGKFEEVQHFIPEIAQLEMDLPEIQSLDTREIIAAKLHEARKRHDGQLLVEDTSLELSALNGFPGPLIKWWIKSVGIEGIWRVCDALGDTKARAVCTFGYAHGESIEYFVGTIEGHIVAPRKSDRAFGWDEVFLPDGETRTYSQMDIAYKNTISHRGIALAKLVAYLKNGIT